MTVAKQVANGLRESILSHMGKETEGAIFDVEQIDGAFVKNLRHRLGLSQSEFSIRFGFSKRTVQKWETNSHSPEGPARTYLLVISEIPNEVSAALEAASCRRAKRRV